MKRFEMSDKFAGASLLGALILLTASSGLFAERRSVRVVEPFESGAGFTPANQVDELVLATFRKKDIQPANRCSDVVFCRRVFLDVIGTLPEPQEVQEFLNDKRPNKRALLIDKLLARDEFADYWALKWSDLLRVKAEFPINLWPNAVQTYHRWIRDSIAKNMPYDQFARELLTSSGSNFRVPPVNFYRAIQGQEPATISAAVGLTFMGVRVDQWPEARRTGMAAFFSRVAFKVTAEWKEEIVCLDPAPTESLNAAFPNGMTVKLPPGEDPREIFANWLVAPHNPWFARNVVNRQWSWLMGRGIVHEPDDLRKDNPPVHPELLTYLEQELVKAKWDLKHTFRLILNSRTYQQSSIPRIPGPEAEQYFACYPVRRLDAEVLIDALNWIYGGAEDYQSAIPEPFTFIPEQQRTIKLADGSISSPFLEMYGRPARDTGLESERNNQPTDAQRLHLLNSTHVQSKIEKSPRLARLINTSGGKRPFLIRAIYLNVMSRPPTPAEEAAAEKYFTGGQSAQSAKGGKKGSTNIRYAVGDLAWALTNTKEFLYRH